MIDNKYRVHEVAKDFDIKSNIVIDLLGKYFDDKKKHMTALEPDELDLIFDTFTKENQVEDLNTYFNYMPASKKSEAKPEPEQEQPATAEEKAPEQPKSESKPEAKPAEKPAQKQEAPRKPKPQSKLPLMPERKPAPEKKKENKPMQSRTKGEARTIDTRADNVDLEKYNEKYENIAPTNQTMQHANSVGKQKIKQKSQQYRKQGGRMRSSRRRSS